MAAVNRVDWQPLGFADLWDKERFATPLVQQLDYYEKFLAWAESLGRPFKKMHPVLNYLKQNQPSDEPLALCWGDAKPPNLMIERDSAVITGVLDWEMVHLGSPVEDLAWWLMADRCFSEGIGVERSAGFPGYDETVSRWENLTGFAAADLPYYEVLALFRFSIHIGRIGLQMKHKGIVPEDNTFDVDNLASQTLAKRLREVGA